MYFQGEIQIALFKDASFYLDRHVDAESSGRYLKVTLCGHYSDIISIVWIILGLYIYIKSFTGNPEAQLSLSKRSMVLTGKKQSQVNHLESRAETVLKLTRLNCLTMAFGLHQFSSVQSLSCVWLFATPWTAARQASLSFTISQTCSNSCPLSQWCHPTISSSVVPFSSRLQSFPASGFFPVSQFFTSGGLQHQLQLQHQSFHWIFRTDFL